MTYNELDQIVGLGYPLDTLTVLDPAEIDADLLEDLIFTTAELLETEDFKGSGVSGREVAERFLRASIRGWQYAVENQEEVVGIVLESCGGTGAGGGRTPRLRPRPSPRRSRRARSDPWPSTRCC